MNPNEHLRRAAARPWLWLAAVLVIALVVVAACMSPAVDDTPEVTPEDVPGDTVPAATVESAPPAEATATVAAEEEVASEEPATAPDPVATELLSPAIASDETYKGLPVGFTEDGMPYRGDPNAPLVMVEYSDFGG